MKSKLEKQIREAIEPEIKSVIAETEARIQAFAERYKVPVTEVKITIPKPDIILTAQLKASQKY
jgi:hypothetical protein